MGNPFIRMWGLGGVDAMEGMCGGQRSEKWISLSPPPIVGRSCLSEVPVPMAFSEKGLWLVN